MNKMEKERIAYHEAGHAAMALYLQIPICFIRIGDPRPDVVGACFIMQEEWLASAIAHVPPRPAKSMRRRAVAFSHRHHLWAGWLAEERWRRSSGSTPAHYSFWRTYDGADVKKLAIVSGALEGWVHYDRYEVRHTLRWLWPVVEALAQALLKKGRLRWPSIRKIALDACQNPWKFAPKEIEPIHLALPGQRR
jgi:hypothetical protein